MARKPSDNLERLIVMGKVNGRRSRGRMHFTVPLIDINGYKLQKKRSAMSDRLTEEEDVFIDISEAQTIFMGCS